MDDAGQRLKKRREELNLRYRDVEDASNQIAARRKNDEYSIALSRLADIENKGIVPSI
jgi:transcriptional regulator with XRE-family HTH domain